MNKIQIYSKDFGGNRALLLASKIFFALTLFILLGLSNSSAQAYEWVDKGLKEESLLDFPKQETSTPLSSQFKKKGYIFGIKVNLEVNTIWSKPKNKLKSEQLINRYFSDNELLNEFPLEPEVSVGGKAAKLLEIRF